MNTFEEIKAILREKNGKKLIILSVVVFLIITAIVFFTAFNLCGLINLRQMDEYLEEIPKIVDSLKEELRIHNRIYQDDILARAELGLKLYGEESELTDAEKLEKVRSAVSADSVSLLGGQRQLLFTTGSVSPEEHFSACIQALEPRSPHLELYPERTESGEETDKNDGKNFVLLPLPGNAQRSLVFEFSNGEVLELQNELDDWSGVLERLFSEDDVIAFAKTGDKVVGYPLDDYTPEQTERLYEELEKIFEDTDSFRRAENGRGSKLITLLGKRYSAALKEYAQEDTEILLTVPLINVIKNGIFIAVSISAIIGLGMVLLQLYVFRRLIRQKAEKEKKAISLKEVLRATCLGILVVLAVTVIFSAMLLLLDNRSHTAFMTTVRREDVQLEIDLHANEESAIRSAFANLYKARTQMFADYLTERPDEQTPQGLKELSDIAGTEYVMRFDSAGQETVASNSYTGFAVGDNLSEEYRAVLMGYPSAIVGPAADPYTGKMQIGTAILMTDEAGKPDGFLLAVYSAGDLNAELKRMGYVNTINTCDVHAGHLVAAINNEDGRFIAHTNPEMIGQKAEDFLEDFKPGASFEGYTEYNGREVCISASAADGKTLMFIVPEQEDSYAQSISYPVILAVLLILALLYYPMAGMLIAREVDEVKEKIQPSAGVEKPMRAFSSGYSVFMTLFALFALIASANGWWTSFDYVFDGKWSKGVDLMSLWAALFVLAVTLFVVFLIRTGLKRLEDRLSLQGRTIARLTRSLIAYAAGIFLFFCILDMFGVNTTTLLASAGVISIAAGMGAQSMAADLLAGFFMMLEGSMHVGDQVSVTIGRDNVKGFVTDMGIRTTEITDDKGNVLIMNNSKISPIYNMSRKNHDKQEPEKDE